MERARRFCRRVAHFFYRPYALRRIRRPSKALLQGRALLTHPEVFHPVCFHSTRLLIDFLRTLDLSGRRFLDMGTGSGSIGIFAAVQGALVTACDVNPRAVALAAENARRNGVGVEVLESNLFAALDGRQFDVICFNVPFYPKAPRTPLEAAFYAGADFETVRAFVSRCAEFLTPVGIVIVIFSEDSGRDFIRSLFAADGFTAFAESTRTRLFERFHILCLRRGTATP
jgi:methylase of polypeptide subunit release factors